MICHEEKKENFAGFRRNGRWEKTEQIISIDADALCIPSMNRSREEAAGQNGCGNSAMRKKRCGCSRNSAAE